MFLLSGRRGWLDEGETSLRSKQEFTICSSRCHSWRPSAPPSSASSRPETRPRSGPDGSHWSSSDPPVPEGPEDPRPLIPMLTVPSSHVASPCHLQPFLLAYPPLPPLLLPLGRCGAGIHPESLHFLHIWYNQDKKSWEHSFPMILKWHQGQCGPAAWLTAWLANWRPEAFRLRSHQNTYLWLLHRAFSPCHLQGMKTEKCPTWLFVLRDYHLIYPQKDQHLLFISAPFLCSLLIHALVMHSFVMDFSLKAQFKVQSAFWSVISAVINSVLKFTSAPTT